LRSCKDELSSKTPFQQNYRIQMNIVRTVLLVVCSLFLVSCSGTRGQLDPLQRPPELTASAVPEYRLGASDVVAVNVWKNPDLSVRVPVRPDGYISVPLVGDVN